MAAIACPNCGHQGEVPNTFRGQKVRCPRCREKLRVPRGQPVLLIGIVLCLLIAATGVAGFLILTKPPPQTEPEQAATQPVVKQADPIETKPAPPPVAPALPILVVKKADGPTVEQLAEAARKQEEAERLAQEAARLEKEREQKAREAKEKRLALKRQPAIATQLEEIERDPVKFLGQYVTVDRLSVKMPAIAMHPDLGRFTIGVTSSRGRYFSRVPLGGVVVSTTEQAARKLVEKAGPRDLLPRVKLFCEIRQWDKNGRANPEAFAYRIEIYDDAGLIDAVVETR